MNRCALALSTALLGCGGATSATPAPSPAPAGAPPPIVAGGPAAQSTTAASSEPVAQQTTRPSLPRSDLKLFPAPSVQLAGFDGEAMVVAERSFGWISAAGIAWEACFAPTVDPLVGRLHRTAGAVPDDAYVELSVAQRRFLFRWDGAAWKKGPFSGYSGVRIGSIFARNPKGGLEVLTLEPAHESGIWTRLGRTTTRLARRMSREGCLRHAEVFTGTLDANDSNEVEGIEELVVTAEDVLLLCTDGVERWVGDAGAGVFTALPIATGSRKLVRFGDVVRLVATRPDGTPYVAKRAAATWTPEEPPKVTRALVFSHADAHAALFREVDAARVHRLAADGRWSTTDIGAPVASAVVDPAGALWVATAEKPPRLLHQKGSGWEEVATTSGAAASKFLEVRRVGPLVLVETDEGTRATTRVEETTLPEKRARCPARP